MAARDGRVELEGWRVRNDGSRFWANVVVDAIRDEAGTLIGFAKVTRDISERKEAAAALERANAALFQSQKMEAIGQLVRVASPMHFNNLLAVISRTPCRFLCAHADRGLTWRIRGCWTLIQRAVDRGASLTQQLLSFARQQPLKTEAHNLDELIHAFEPMLHRAGNAAIRLETKLASRHSAVLLDAARFEAALLNLVVNAHRCTSGRRHHRYWDGIPGASCSYGRYAWRPALYAVVQLSVSDTGTGMLPEVAARAFEPFFTTKDIGKGTGLGLSQVYGFIVQSGGDVVIRSVAGEGTTIDIYLPATADSSKSDDYSRHRSVETVLLVEGTNLTYSRRIRAV